MKYILAFLFMASVAMAEERYLEVTERVEPSATPVVARIVVTDYADATNQLPEVVSEYFVGLDYKAEYHEHYHGPTERKPCEVTPVSQGLTKYVEVSTVVDERYYLPEMIRVGYTDDADADQKVDKVKKSKWFKGKQVKVVKK